MQSHDLFTQAQSDTRTGCFGYEERNENLIQKSGTLICVRLLFYSLDMSDLFLVDYKRSNALNALTSFSTARSI